MAPERTSAPDLDAPVAPWSYNPAAWSQRVPIALLAAVGFLISTYLALYQWRLVDSAWDPVFGDGTMKVLDSNVSHWMKGWMIIPDASLGAVAYLGDAVYGMAGSTRRWQYRPWMVLLFGFDVIPLGIVSVILVVAQGTVVGWWCFLCLVTAVISLILIYWAVDEVWSCLVYLRRVWQLSGKDKRALWNTLIGRPSEVAERAAQELIERAREKTRQKVRERTPARAGR